MAYFDSKIIDYFSNYGKVVGLLKACRCGELKTTEPMPNIVDKCSVCNTHVHTCFTVSER